MKVERFIKSLTEFLTRCGEGHCCFCLGHGSLGTLGRVLLLQLKILSGQT